MVGMHTAQRVLRTSAVRIGLLGVTLAGFAATPALAQPSAVGDVAVGYSFQSILDDEGFSLPVGWLTSVSGRIADSPFSIVGEAAGNYRAEAGELLRFHTFQGGVRVGSGRDTPVRPFAQFLVGLANLGCCGESDAMFAIEPGGGVDVDMGRRTALRVALSFPMIFDDGESGHTARVFAGVAFPFGR